MASLGSLVIELAANTARLQGDLGRGVSMLQGFASKAKSVLGVFGVGVGGGLLGGLARQAIELGDELQKGAQRAGVAASTFSELAAAAKQVDVDIGTLSKGLKSIQLAVSEAASGNKEAADAFYVLGLNIDRLRNLSADKQLKEIASALANIPNQNDRVRLGTVALGKAYQELVPLLDQGAIGISRLVEEQKKLGATFTDEQIKKLAETDDAIKRLKASWSGFATTLTAEVAPALTRIFDHFGKAASLEERSRNIQGQLAGLQVDSPERRQRLSELADVQRQRQEELRNKRLQAVSRGSGYAPAVADANRQFLIGREAREKAAKEEATKFARLQEKINEDIQKDRWETNQILTEATRDVIEEQSNLLGGSKQVFETYMDDLSRYTRNTTSEMSVFAEQAARNMQDAFADFLFDPFQDGLKGLLRGFIDVLRRMVAQAAAAKVFDALTKKYGSGSTSAKSSGASNILTTILGAIFGGAKAGGGPVSRGKAYLVGERGPEMFLPSQNGAIAANGSGGVTFAPVYNIDARGATMELANALPAILKRNNEQLKTEIVQGYARGKWTRPR